MALAFTLVTTKSLHSQDPKGKWMMIQRGDTYTIPSGYIEEITDQQLITYNYDKVHIKTPLQIDTINHRFIFKNNHTLTYRLYGDRILTKTQINHEGEPIITDYVRLLPTTIHYPIKEVLKKQYKMRDDDTPGNMLEQIFDFNNADILNSVHLSIDNILGTYCIVGTYRKEKAWFFPIKEIHQDHLLIYGLDPIKDFIKLQEYIPKEKLPVQGKLNVFIEPKLDLLIQELGIQKDKLYTEIEEASKEWDFLIAHHLTEAYHKVNKKFNALSAIKNKNHHHITTYEMLVKMQKENVEKETDKYLVKVTLDAIEEYEEKLGKLKAQEHELRPEAYQLKDAIFQLCDQNIQSITLILKEEYHTSLHMSIEKNNLILLLQCHGKEGYLDCDFQKLNTLGFLAEESNYTYVFKKFDKEKIEHVITFLSRFTFDVFHAQSLDNPMKLIFQ
ncbi:hypothetical protein [Aquimarina algiphila]|uniref:hypothetical protein n=1 Tax=Aquimarina algiphila TaxID=2047982 RepID=UPI00232AC6C7|nr:hypothetical protein [Aquimarina algiphila]